MGNLAYFGLGILLGLGISIYFIVSREERIEKKIAMNQKMYSTEKLDKTMEIVVEKISKDIKRLRRELTEEEKNQIIIESYKEKFLI